MLKKHQLINFAIYSYIALPFIIFAAGFLKWYFAFGFTVLLLVSLYLAASDSEYKLSIPFKNTDMVKIVIGLLFIIIIVLLSGIGNIFWQNNDHATRNTIFDILVNEPWPPKSIVNGKEVGLVYYIGFWLPSALIGKVISLEAGYMFSVVWAVLGLALLWLLLCAIHKKVVLYPLFIFMFFSGLDIIGHSFVNITAEKITTMRYGMWAFRNGAAITSHIEWWPGFFQYSSHITQLFWVFNQALPVWISTIVLLLEKNNKNLVFIMGLTLLSSTLPFIGLIPIFFWCAMTNHDDPLLNRSFTKDVKHSFKSLFTFQNLFGGGISGILSFLYLRSNIASSAAVTTASATTTTTAAKAASEPTFSSALFILVIVLWCAAFFMFAAPKKKGDYLRLLPSIPIGYFLAQLTSARLNSYLLFIVLEVVIIAALIYPVFKSSSLYFITVCSLLIVPFFKVGRSIDFCMRASIPLLVVLSLFLIASVKTYTDKKSITAIIISTVVITLGCFTPIHEIARTIDATLYEKAEKGEVINDSVTVESVFKGKNFTGATDDNLFFEVFAK